MTMKRFAITAFAMFFATLAEAQIYQWKDENGKTVMSDIPPAGRVRQQRQLSGESSTTVTPPAQKSVADRDLEFRKRQKDSQEAEDKTRKEQAAAQDKKENCAATRRYLQTLESGERIALRDDKGERYFMEDAQREAEIAKARQNIRTQCQ